MDKPFYESTSEDRRTVFWSTQPNVGQVSSCGVDCGIPGLALIDQSNYESCVRCQTLGEPTPKVDNPPTTIATSNWVKGLLLNILFTNGRSPDTPCGHRPGSIGGHWSESFSRSGIPFGNLLHTIPQGYRMQELVKLAAQYVRIAVEKLISYGVSNKVDVESTYVGGGVVVVNVTIYGSDGQSENVGISGSIVDNYWVWQS